MKYISEKERLRRIRDEQQNIVDILEVRLNRSLTDDEKIKLFRGAILLPIRKRAINDR